MSLRRHTYQSEDRAFEQLYGRYAQNVFRYALTVLGQQADAEDATQTTFLNAYRAYRRGERPLQPERWLISIAHNTCRERYRHAQRRPHEVSLDEALAIAGIEDDQRTTAEELRKALMELPESQRSALVMRELEGRSYAETAAALHISGSALETLLFRARASLREQLNERLSCNEAADAIAMQLTGRLPNRDKAILRAHLRTCDACAALARSRRAQKRTRGSLSSLPSWLGRLLPSGLAGTSATGGVGAAGLVLKAAAVVVVGTAAGGVAYEGVAQPASFNSHRTGAHVAASSVSNVSVRRSTSGGGSTGMVSSSSATVSSSMQLPSDETTTVAATSPSPAAPPPAAAPQTSNTTNDAQGTVDGGTATTTSTTTTETTTAAATTEAAPASTPAAKVPPGQAKKADATSSSASSTQTSTTDTSSSNVPPGQAKKNAATSSTDTTASTDTSSSSNLPPGQAKKDAAAASSTDTTATTTTTTTTNDTSSNTPPGQAKKDATQDSSSASNTPPGKGKKSGNSP